MKKLFRTYWPSSIWLTFILVATLLPGDKIPQSKLLELDLSDKYIHLILFSVMFLAILFDTHRNKQALTKKIYRFTWLFTISLGVATELLQVFVVTSRSGNLFDLVADALGCLIGYGISKFVLKRSRSQIGESL